LIYRSNLLLVFPVEGGQQHSGAKGGALEMRLILFPAVPLPGLCVVSLGF
jgi:hypothetical protein